MSITGDNASAFNMGDVLTLIGGFFFAAHIVAVSRYSEGRDIFILTTSSLPPSPSFPGWGY